MSDFFFQTSKQIEMLNPLLGQPISQLWLMPSHQERSKLIKTEQLLALKTFLCFRYYALVYSYNQKHSARLLKDTELANRLEK